MNYLEAVDEIINIPRFNNTGDGTNKSGNDNLLRVLEKLGNPQLGTKSIHIAGTNGKGSTCQFVKCILNKLGYDVGVFTSPHLTKINQRIEISYGCGKNCASHYISDMDFLKCYELVKTAIARNQSEGGKRLSFFEVVFAIATVYFDEKKPDYVIYETGLGGRLDATNVILPEITAITSIGLDHTEYLGDTIELIAKEKAGIIKHGVPVVYNTGDSAADFVIEKQASAMTARAINVAKSDYIINELTDKTIDFSIYNSYYRYNNLVIPTAGALYQVDNAMTAIAICNCIVHRDGIVPENDIKEALADFVWEGRMERIHPNIILDGAHNTDAVMRFVQGVKALCGDRKIYLLFAVAGDKDYRPMIKHICSELRIGEVFVTALNSKRGISSEYIADIFREYLKGQAQGVNAPVDASYVVENDDISASFKMAYKAVENTENLLFCVGSLYLVGDIKRIAGEVLND